MALKSFPFNIRMLQVLTSILIDVLLMKKYSWKPEGGAPIIEDIPADQMEKATELHKALIEAAAENDEGLMEKFFDEGNFSEDEMREGIRKGLASPRHVPRILRMCRQRYGRAPFDGILG
jgi:translation elongation factor EF-G